MEQSGVLITDMRDPKNKEEEVEGDIKDKMESNKEIIIRTSTDHVDDLPLVTTTATSISGMNNKQISNDSNSNFFVSSTDEYIKKIMKVITSF